RLQLVEVLVYRVARLDAVLDAVQAGQQLRRGTEVRVARRVRGTELDALGRGGGAGQRDADRGGAVARGVHEGDRGLDSGVEATVGVDGRLGDRQDRRGVGQQAADVVAGRLGEAGVALLVVEQRLAVLPQGLVGVHAAPAVVEKRLRHEGGDLAV